MITFALQKFHIMAEKERYDTERMIMRAQYAMSLIEDSRRGVICQIWNEKTSEDRYRSCCRA